MCLKDDSDTDFYTVLGKFVCGFSYRALQYTLPSDTVYQKNSRCRRFNYYLCRRFSGGMEIFMGAILFFIGLALSLNGLYCGMTIGMGAGEAIIVVSGIIFILWGTFYAAFRKKGFLKFIKRLFIFYMIILVVYTGAVTVIGRMDNATGNEDYAIVLGAKITGANPSAALAKRLDKAAEFANENKNATIIVSGGQGADEKIPEAQAMEDYLISHGVSAERILKEENSTSTYENLMNSKNAITEGSAALITSDFHVIRSAQMAQLCGINATHIGAETPWYLIPVSCAREMAAEIATVRYYF